VYVPKKEVVAPPMKAINQTSIIIGSIEILVDEVEKPIFIENLAQPTMKKVEEGVLKILLNA
jgi:hypothetical protein